MKNWEEIAFAPIRAESTPSLVARKLRDLVSSGYFAPGQQLPEVQLAKQFGVSRSVLREALQRLTQEGLVTSRPNRGMFVTEYEPEEVIDIYTARLAIERSACLKVVEVTGTGEALADSLDKLTDQLEAQAAGGASDAEIASSDIEFHEHLVAAAASPRLNRMHATLAAESRMFATAYENEVYPVSERIAAHREIAEAIRERDVARLHRALADHMDGAIARIVEHIEAQTEPTDLIA